jgi:hypothetical protein
MFSHQIILQGSENIRLATVKLKKGRESSGEAEDKINYWRSVD